MGQVRPLLHPVRLDVFMHLTHHHHHHDHHHGHYFIILISNLPRLARPLDRCLHRHLIEHLYQVRQALVRHRHLCLTAPTPRRYCCLGGGDWRISKSLYRQHPIHSHFHSVGFPRMNLSQLVHLMI